MAKARHPFNIRYPLLIYIKTMPFVITVWFYIATFSVLGIELIGKRFEAINHMSYVLGDIWLKLCYSLCAAIIFYFINQHLPKQKRKLKSIPFLASKLGGIHFEVVLLIQTISKDFTEQNFSNVTRKWLDEACSKINLHHPVTTKESAKPFVDWFEYLNYKSNKIKILIDNLLPLEDIIEPKLMAVIYFIDQRVSGISSLNFDRKRIPNTSLSYFSSNIWGLVVESEHAFRVKGKNHALLERLHHHLYRKEKYPDLYFKE